jgi:hypothetical protein
VTEEKLHVRPHYNRVTRETEWRRHGNCTCIDPQGDVGFVCKTCDGIVDTQYGHPEVCEACDGFGSLMYQWAKTAMLECGGSAKPFTDKRRKGIYYVTADGLEMCMKTIGGSCTICNGTGRKPK